MTHLKQLHIYKGYNGEYHGTAEFENELGKVSLTLLPEHTNIILKACGNALICTSEKVAIDLSKLIDRDLL